MRIHTIRTCTISRRTAALILLAGSLFAGSGAVCRAQVIEEEVPQQDTVQVQEPPQEEVRGSQSQSILNMKMQRRWRPADEPFERGSILSNSFIYLRAGFYRPFANNFSTGIDGALVLDKWFGRFHGMRVSAGASTFMENFEAGRVSMLNLRASYIFNLSAFLGGYKPGRVVDVRPLAGLGYSPVLQSDIPAQNVLSAHLGASVSIRLGPGVYAFIDPSIEWEQDALQLSRMDVWRNYIVSLRADAGIGVTLDRRGRSGDPGQNWFVGLGGAAQVQNSDLVHKGSGLFDKIGPAAYLYFGRRYPRNWSWRVVAGASTHSWFHSVEDEIRLPSSYFFLRWEAMYNFIPLIWPQSRLAVSACAGPEFGYMSKKDLGLVINYPYCGLSAGLQVKHPLSVKENFLKHLAACLELRTSLIPYSAVSYGHVSANQNYYDGIVNLGFGLEYHF